MPELTIPEVLLPIIEKRKRFKIVIGGRGSGKSQTIGDVCLMDAQVKGIKTACFREYQNTIDDSVYSLLSSEIDRLGLDGFEVQSNRIMLGGDECFKFRGLARNPEGIKSMHGFQRFWVEEAQTISAASLKALTPTLRVEDSEIWMTANPMSRADPFSQRFIVPFEKDLQSKGYYEDDLHLIIMCNYSDNPFFPQVLENERAYDQKNIPPALYRHIWEGDFYDEVLGAIIPVEWFDAAIDAHEKLGFKPEGAIIASFDPSDEGGDSKGFAIRKGSVFLDVAEMKHGDSAQGMDWAIDRAESARADWFVWDADGLGVALKRQVESGLSGKRTEWIMFKGSEGVDDPDLLFDATGSESSYNRKKNKDALFNKRAQHYWRLRTRFYNTFRAVSRGEYVNPDEMISLSSDIEVLDQLRAEVCRIPLKPNNNGKIQIMSKIDMAKKPYQLPSPNMADALMMSMIMPKAVSSGHVSIKFDGWG